MLGNIPIPQDFLRVAEVPPEGGRKNIIKK
jgi:hypothetical protein